MIKSFALSVLSLSLAAGCAVDSGQDVEATPAAGAQEATVRHCVTQLGSSQLSCYASFPEMISAATGGRVSDAPSDARLALSDPQFLARIDGMDDTVSAAARPRAGGPLIGLEFKDRDFRGDQLAITASFGTGCDGNLATNEYSTLVLPGDFNDSISSFQGFANCAQKLFENANFGGASTPTAFSSSYVGDAMNDRTSTIMFF